MLSITYTAIKKKKGDWKLITGLEMWRSLVTLTRAALVKWWSEHLTGPGLKENGRRSVWESKCQDLRSSAVKKWGMKNEIIARGGCRTQKRFWWNRRHYTMLVCWWQWSGKKENRLTQRAGSRNAEAMKLSKGGGWKLVHKWRRGWKRARIVHPLSKDREQRVWNRRRGVGRWTGGSRWKSIVSISNYCLVCFCPF